MDLLKKTLQLGFGITALTKEKAEKFVKEAKKHYNLNEKEGKKLVADLLKQSDKTQKEIAGIVKKHVDLAVNATGLATKKDLANLEKKLVGKKKPTKKKAKKKK